MFCVLVFSLSRGEIARRTFRQLERMVRRATEEFIFSISNDPDHGENERLQSLGFQTLQLRRR
jgi:hypothetical protein